MDRPTFLAAAAKAAEIRFRCEAAFTAVRDMTEAARNAKQRRNIADQHLARLKASPAMRGSAPDRERVSAEIARHEFDRDEAANELAAAEKIAEEYRQRADSLAPQRDSTRQQIETWRRELSATERGNTSLIRDHGNGERVGVHYHA